MARLSVYRIPRPTKSVFACSAFSITTLQLIARFVQTGRDHVADWARDHVADWACDHVADWACDHGADWARDCGADWARDYGADWARDYDADWARDHGSDSGVRPRSGLTHDYDADWACEGRSFCEMSSGVGGVSRS